MPISCTTIHLKHFPLKGLNKVTTTRKRSHSYLVVQDLDRITAATYDTSYNVEQHKGALTLILVFDRICDVGETLPPGV